MNHKITADPRLKTQLMTQEKKKATPEYNISASNFVKHLIPAKNKTKNLNFRLHGHRIYSKFDQNAYNKQKKNILDQ